MREEHENPVYRIVGINIKNKRQTKKINQSELSSRLSISRTSLVNIEQGRQYASLILLYKIAKVLECDLHEIIPSSVEIIKQTNVPKYFDNYSDMDLVSKSKKGVQDFMEQFTN